MNNSQTYLYLAQQVLGILGFQIEMEKVFNIASVIISLHRSILGNEICHVVMTTKNWPNDVHVEFEFGKDSISNFNMVHEEALFEHNEILIQEEGFLEDDT
jgi:hypothetical protein